MARPATNETPTSAQWREGFYTPAVLLYYAVYYFLANVLRTLITNPAGIFNLQTIKDEAFSKFWLYISATPDPPPKPSELVGAAALVPGLLAQASGDVLEIGPGSGAQLPYLPPQNITSYHAAEPARGLHPLLSRRLEVVGFSPGSYHLHPCSADPSSLLPGLARAGLLPKEAMGKPLFDTIITLRVLCSVPDPAGTARMLHSLLRPGGKLIVLEHVVNPSSGPWGSTPARILQKVYTLLGWSFFVGDCHLERDTEGVLRGLAWRNLGREKGSVKGRGGDEGLRSHFWWACLTYISGVLVKE